ncbi:MAG: Rha family transcriptional regulator, partial [Lachnospiraceae bacterium]|nr:Rha family transcriptional regulator [Lachnospiraceae bacterium]
MQKIEQTITTLEIAEMMEVPHWQILRKLDGTKKSKGVIRILNDNKIVVVDYFIQSTYEDDKGEERPCYKVTKLGCDFLANKFQGEKGIVFTAKYVKRFHDMEQAITQLAVESKKQPQLTPEEVVDWKLNDLNKRLKILEESQPAKSHGLGRLTPRKDTWYEKNRSRIWRIRYDKDIELKELYHIILEECGKYYDLEEAERLYRGQNGRGFIYPIDVVEHFPELQEIA